MDDFRIIIMKTGALLFLFFVCIRVCSQNLPYVINIPATDTIVLDIEDIEKVERHIIDTKTVFSENYYVHKKNHENLDGFYKIRMNQEVFYVTHFMEGNDHLPFNYKFYYKNDVLSQVEFKGFSVWGTKYIKVNNYSLLKKKLEGQLIDMITDSVIEEVMIKQCVKDEVIRWKIKYAKGKKGIFQFSKQLIKEEIF